MKQFIIDAVAHAKHVVEKTQPLYRHGLQISVKPRTNGFDFEDGDIQVEGDIYDPKEVPGELAPLFENHWVDGEDQLSASSLAEVKYIVCADVKSDMTITHKGTTAIFLRVKKDCTIKVNSVNNFCRIHVIVESGNCVIKHNSTGSCVSVKKAIVKNGSLNWVNRIYTAQYVRDYCTNTYFGGKGSIKTVYAVEGKGIVDVLTESKHYGQSESDIVTRGVVRDSAKALSRGTISIGQSAGGSEAYEQQDVLLLSDDAEADAIPNLEIHNNDVKCSHGSTIGSIDEEQIFYMMSRGLSRLEAEEEIVAGYLSFGVGVAPSE